MLPTPLWTFLSFSGTQSVDHLYFVCCFNQAQTLSNWKKKSILFNWVWSDNVLDSERLFSRKVGGVVKPCLMGKRSSPKMSRGCSSKKKFTDLLSDRGSQLVFAGWIFCLYLPQHGMKVGGSMNMTAQTDKEPLKGMPEWKEYLHQNTLMGPYLVGFDSFCDMKRCPCTYIHTYAWILNPRVFTC